MHSQDGQDYSLIAAADLNSSQYHAVALNTTSGKAEAIAAAGQKSIGVLQNNPAAGDAAQVRGFGFSPAKYGGTVDEDDYLTVDSTGKLVKNTGANDSVVGRAIVPGVDGDIGLILLGGRQDNVGTHVVTLPCPDLSTISGSGDILTNYTPGFAGRIVKFSCAVLVAVTTADKLATFNLEIGTTNVTGGALATTSALLTPVGKVVDATAITAANTFSATDTISIEVSGVTAYAEGRIYFLLVLAPA